MSNNIDRYLPHWARDLEFTEHTVTLVGLELSGCNESGEYEPGDYLHLYDLLVKETLRLFPNAKFIQTGHYWWLPGDCSATGILYSQLPLINPFISIGAK